MNSTIPHTVRLVRGADLPKWNDDFGIGPHAERDMVRMGRAAPAA
jgi:hypothetical protein